MNSPPRIRGQVGQADSPPEVKDKYFYEITLWDFAGEKQYGTISQLGPFDTEEEACAAGKKAVQIVSETIEEKETGKKSGRYFDLKNGGIMRPWEEHS